MDVETLFIDSSNIELLEQIALLRIMENSELEGVETEKLKQVSQKRLDNITNNVLIPMMDEEADGTNFILAHDRYKGEFLGYIQGRVDMFDTLLYRSTGLFVSQEHRKKGVGKKLKESQHIFAKNKGYKGIITTTTKKNEHAIRLLKSLGYQLDNALWKNGLEATLIF